MYSLTAQMISQNPNTAAMMAKKLSETEGVPYEVVKEPKGYRIVQSGGKKPAPEMKTVEQIANATGGLKLKTQAAEPLVSAATAPLPPPIYDHSHGVFQVLAEFEKETPTMVYTLIDGVKRVFGKNDRIGWNVEKDFAANKSFVALTMTPEKAKKWKLMKSA